MTVMKTKSIFLLLLSLVLFACSGNKEPRILIAYYSQSGNTKAVAEQIQAKFGGDLFEIGLKDPYPASEQETIEIAGRQREEKMLPELSNVVGNMNEYDIVFIGTPIWFGTASLPMLSFVGSHDFAGKTVIPFYTCGGGGEGTYVADVKAICKGAVFLGSFGTTRPERAAGTHIEKVARHLDQLTLGVERK